MEKIDGRYKVLKSFGRGAYGEVFLCHDEQMQRTVAVKTLHFEQSTGMRRFRSEAQLLSSLRHPSIVRILAFGISENDGPYYVMEPLEGMTLAAAIKTENLSPQQFVIVFEQILDGLHHIHENGILHRDLKPSNIMLTFDQGVLTRVVLIDFGLSKASHSVNLTTADAIIGTPYYMSPEQCRGEQLDKRSDLYSVGCVMYEAVTGSPLFQGQPLEVMMAHQSGAAVDFPIELKPLLSKLLAPAKQDRFESAAAALEVLSGLELGKYARFSGVVEPSKSVPFNVSKLNRPLLVAALFCLVLFVVLAGSPVGSSLFWHGSMQKVSTNAHFSRAEAREEFTRETLVFKDQIDKGNFDAAVQTKDRMEGLAARNEDLHGVYARLAGLAGRLGRQDQNKFYSGKAAQSIFDTDKSVYLDERIAYYNASLALNEPKSAFADDVERDLTLAMDSKALRAVAILSWFRAMYEVDRHNLAVALKYFEQAYGAVSAVPYPDIRFDIIAAYASHLFANKIDPAKQLKLVKHALEDLLDASENNKAFAIYKLKTAVQTLVAIGPVSSEYLLAQGGRIRAVSKKWKGFDRVLALESAAFLFSRAGEKKTCAALLDEAIRYSEQHEPEPKVGGASAANAYVAEVRPELPKCIEYAKKAFVLCRTCEGMTLSSRATSALCLAQLYAKAGEWETSSDYYVLAAEDSERYANYVGARGNIAEQDFFLKLALNCLINEVLAAKEAHNAARESTAKVKGRKFLATYPKFNLPEMQREFAI